jgi:hypothetical protein
VGKAKKRMFTFKQMITAECEMDVPMKPSEVLTEPYRFICDYAELGPEYLKLAKQKINLMKIVMLEFHKKQVKTNIDDNSDLLVSSHFLGPRKLWRQEWITYNFYHNYYSFTILCYLGRPSPFCDSCIFL